MLGSVLKKVDATFPPRVLHRRPEKQAVVDQATASMAVYEFDACPFCVRLRRTMRRLSLNIELRDALNDQVIAGELIREGGQRQVPCLRIIESDGSVRWMYESKDIIRYLEKRFA